MLFNKFWMETRIRFYIGVVFVTAVCLFFVLAEPWILNQWHMDQVKDPTIYNPPWLLIAQKDYPFFLWHFLYNYLLQLIWAIFTVMLALGGLSTEAESGSILYTLAIPVKRSELFLKRFGMGYGQACLLALVPLVVLPLFSNLIGCEYPFIYTLPHALLFVGGGSVLYSVGTLINTVIKTEAIAFFIAIGVVIVFYFLFQPFSEGQPKPLYLKLIDLPGLMAGNPHAVQLTMLQMVQIVICFAFSGLLLLLSHLLLQKRDF